MDNNTRSYISRFSGLLLFLLTLLVVGVLVILTVRAAQDNDSDTASNTDSSEQAFNENSNEGFIIDGDNTFTEDASANDDPEFTINSTDSSSDSSSNGVVATSDEDQNTDTNDSNSAVAGASTDASDDSASSAEAGSDVVAVTGGNELPNTGARETALVAAFVVIALGAYAQSRRDLIASLR